MLRMYDNTDYIAVGVIQIMYIYIYYCTVELFCRRKSCNVVQNRRFCSYNFAIPF